MTAFLNICNKFAWDFRSKILAKYWVWIFKNLIFIHKTSKGYELNRFDDTFEKRTRHSKSSPVRFSDGVFWICISVCCQLNNFSKLANQPTYPFITQIIHMNSLWLVWTFEPDRESERVDGEQQTFKLEWNYIERCGCSRVFLFGILLFVHFLICVQAFSWTTNCINK